MGLLRVYVSNCNILLSFQFLLYYLPPGKHPIRCSSSFSNLQLFFNDSPYTTALILPSTILSRNVNTCLSNVVPLFFLGHAYLRFCLYSDYQPQYAFLCELPLSLAGVQQLVLSIIFQLAQPPPASLLTLHQCL